MMYKSVNVKERREKLLSHLNSVHDTSVIKLIIFLKIPAKAIYNDLDALIKTNQVISKNWGRSKYYKVVA